MASQAEYDALINGAFGDTSVEHKSWHHCPAGNPPLNLDPVPEDFLPFRKFTYHMAGKQLS
jgi:hypothetical protein